VKWHGSPSTHDQQRISLPGDGFAAGIWLKHKGIILLSLVWISNLIFLDQYNEHAFLSCIDTT
jgi:hypothetical protein